MPYQELPDITVYYEFEPQNGKPVLMFSNSLGTDVSLWKSQRASFSKHFSLLMYDTRGHGKTSTTASPYTVAMLGRDALNLLDALSLQRVYFCGLSLGGMIGQWLGIHASERFHRLVLCNTAAQIGTLQGWNERIAAVQQHGMDHIVSSVITRWFTPQYLSDHPDLAETTGAMLRVCDPEGYTGACAAVRDMDQRHEVCEIDTPTLVVFGTLDTVTPPAQAHDLSKNIKNASELELRAAHFSNVEATSEFNQGVLSFLLQHLPAQQTTDESRKRYEQGMAIRRSVLGDAHVNRSVANLTSFNQPFQDFITRYAWGEIWSRPGLPRHTRSLLTLAMMIALNREEEFKMHVKAAFNNGVTKEEIQEVLLQSSLYCGLPAANNAFVWAQAVFDAIGTST